MFFIKENILDAEIRHVKSMMEKLDPSSEEYTRCSNNMKTIMEAKNCGIIDSKTRAIIIANLMGILMILCYENAHIITSKAFGLIRRLF